MIRLRYTPLVSVQFRHAFYQNGRCPDLAVAPTLATGALLKMYDWVARPAAGALTADARAQMGFYNDYWGPAILCGLVMLVLTVIMVVGLVEVLWY